MADWDVNDTWSLKSITADRRLEWTGTRDADNTPLLILHTNYTSESEQFSQEFQALVETDRLDGVIGVYYFDEDSFDRLLVPLGNPGTSYDTQRVSMDTEAKAAFTEWTFKFTDAFSATAGIRYTEETKGLQAIMFNVAPASAPEPAAPTALCPFAGPPPTQTGCLFLTTNRFEREFTATTKSASVQYRFNERVMTYLSWSEGFKSGGFNQRYNAAPPGNAPISFGAETAESFEIGLKLDPRDTLRINIAAFTTDYDDIQMTYRLGVVPLLFNAGVATIDGGELELEFAPTEDFRLDATLGYLERSSTASRRRRRSARDSPTATATLSSRLPFTPEWQGHLGMSYSFHPGSNWSLTPRVDVSYTDDAVLRCRQLAGDRAGRSRHAAQRLAGAGVRRRQVALRARRQQPHRRVVSGGGNVFADHGFGICGNHLRASAQRDLLRHAQFLTAQCPLRSKAPRRGDGLWFGHHRGDGGITSPGRSGCAPRVRRVRLRAWRRTSRASAIHARLWVPRAVAGTNCVRRPDTRVLH